MAQSDSYFATIWSRRISPQLRRSFSSLHHLLPTCGPRQRIWRIIHWHQVLNVSKIFLQCPFQVQTWPWPVRSSHGFAVSSVPSGSVTLFTLIISLRELSSPTSILLCIVDTAAFEFYPLLGQRRLVPTPSPTPLAAAGSASWEAPPPFAAHSPVSSLVCVHWSLTIYYMSGWSLCK